MYDDLACPTFLTTCKPLSFYRRLQLEGRFSDALDVYHTWTTEAGVVPNKSTENIMNRKEDELGRMRTSLYVCPPCEDPSIYEADQARVCSCILLYELPPSIIFVTFRTDAYSTGGRASTCSKVAAVALCRWTLSLSGETSSTAIF